MIELLGSSHALLDCVGAWTRLGFFPPRSPPRQLVQIDARRTPEPDPPSAPWKAHKRWTF